MSLPRLLTYPIQASRFNILDTLENIRLNMRINPPEAVD